jgi:SnoaL-like domain
MSVSRAVAPARSLKSRDWFAMNPLERLIAVSEISDLIGRYCMLFDDEDWTGLDELWADDAAFVVDDVAFEGRQAVMEFLRTCLPAGYRSKHLISRPIVDLAADGRSARARTDVVWIAANFENTIVGRYDDELVHDDRGWRFSRRVERPVPFVPGAPPMSDAANGVSQATMRKPR